ncbi:MAG TPA: DUF3142 domain-containing protein [Thermoanaerobaculia bacterium]|nr:DUF3142 domain-containing protein [Thermoanaerobaculia bacterium]
MKQNPFGARGAILLSLILLALACRHPHASGPLRQEAYVWQRSWSPAVRQAIQQASGISGFVVLAAEVDLRQGSPKIARVPLDPSLKEAGKPIGAALRVTTLPTRFAAEPQIVQLLAGITSDLTAEARAKGIALSEIQIDYDCPESKLDDYRGLLPTLRKTAAPVPLTFTALPSWLGQRRAFGGLIAAADGYVLQVHSLKPPSEPWGEIALLKPEEAREWTDTAARFGRPFRVALPTYGYLAAFDAQGRLLGLSAEGPLLSWPQGITVRAARSDPAVLAGLIRDWTRDRPAELAGVLWFRLPVIGDRLSWSWPALRAVMVGREPHGKVRADVRAPEPGLAEIDLVNEGDGESALPSPVRVRWKEGTFLAADGLAGYQMQPPERNGLSLARPRPGRLRPGERRTIAWLRFASPTEIQIELPRQAG